MSSVQVEFSKNIILKIEKNEMLTFSHEHFSIIDHNFNSIVVELDFK